MIWPFWRTAVLVIVLELVAIGTNVWTLVTQWHDSWVWIGLRLFNLVALCFAAGLACWGLRRAYRLDKEWKERDDARRDY